MCLPRTHILFCPGLHRPLFWPRRTDDSRPHRTDSKVDILRRDETRRSNSRKKDQTGLNIFHQGAQLYHFAKSIRFAHLELAATISTRVLCRLFWKCLWKVFFIPVFRNGTFPVSLLPSYLPYFQPTWDGPTKRVSSQMKKRKKMGEERGTLNFFSSFLPIHGTFFSCLPSENIKVDRRVEPFTKFAASWHFGNTIFI